MDTYDLTETSRFVTVSGVRFELEGDFAADAEIVDVGHFLCPEDGHARKLLEIVSTHDGDGEEYPTVYLAQEILAHAWTLWRIEREELKGCRSLVLLVPPPLSSGAMDLLCESLRAPEHA